MTFIVGFAIYFVVALAVGFVANAMRSSKWQNQSIVIAAVVAGAILGVLSVIGAQQQYGY